MPFTGSIPEPVKVDEFSEFVEDIPSEDGDWAGSTASTRVSLEDDYRFEVSDIAVVADKFEHSYQFVTGVSMRGVRSMQEDIDWFEHSFEPDANGIDESSDGKYSLESRIQALARTVLSDGRGYGSSATEDDITIEYTEHSSLDRYVVLIKW